jgi:hypothetical protein
VIPLRATEGTSRSRGQPSGPGGRFCGGLNYRIYDSRAVLDPVLRVVNGLLLKPLPFRNPDRLAEVFSKDAQGRRQVDSQPDLDDWRSLTHSFSVLGAAEPEPDRRRTVGASPVAILVSLIPVRRAIKVDPTIALRSE